MHRVGVGVREAAVSLRVQSSYWAPVFSQIRKR